MKDIMHSPWKSPVKLTYNKNKQMRLDFLLLLMGQEFFFSFSKTSVLIGNPLKLKKKKKNKKQTNQN